MPVLARFCGIVMRIVIDRTFGTHVHAFFGDSELVIGLNPLRVIQGEVPPWVRNWALDWVNRHQHQLLSAWKIDPYAPTPISRQAARHLDFVDDDLGTFAVTHGRRDRTRAQSADSTWLA
jgi:Domain of unknown function (DUF4160)